MHDTLYLWVVIFKLENPFRQCFEFCVSVFRLTYRVAPWISRTVSDSLHKKLNSVQPAFFFSKWVTRFEEPADMEMENPVEKGKRLLQFWEGKSLHIIDLVYLLKSVQLTWKYLSNSCKKSGKTWSTFSNMAGFGHYRKRVSLTQNSVSLAVNAFKPHVKCEWPDTVCVCASDTEFRWFLTERTLFPTDDTELQFARSELHTFWWL